MRILLSAFEPFGPHAVNASAVVTRRVVARGVPGIELRLPHRGFNRAVGAFRDVHVSPDGRVLSPEEWAAGKDDWLPTPDDEAFVRSLMVPVTEPGKMAGWVAPPSVGINGKPVEFEYVRVA